MIVNVIIGLVNAVLSPIFALLPTFSIVDTVGLTSSGGYGHGTLGFDFGKYIGPLNGIFPARELVALVYGVYVVVLSCLITYKVANWIWRHIPSVAGFGTGAG